MDNYLDRGPTFEAWQARREPWLTPQGALEYRKTLPEGDSTGNLLEQARLNRIMDFGTVLEDLPKNDLLFALELFSAMATDESPILRAEIAQYAHNLYAADKEAGKALFVCGFNDPDDSVWFSAHENLRNWLYDGLIDPQDCQYLLNEYHLARDREAIRNGLLPLTAVESQRSWQTKSAPWESVDQALTYVADLHDDQLLPSIENEKRGKARTDFYQELRNYPKTDPEFATELLQAMAQHENPAVRSLLAHTVIFDLYPHAPQAAKEILGVLAQYSDEVSVSNLRTWCDVALQMGMLTEQEIKALRSSPRDILKSSLRVIQGELNR